MRISLLLAYYISVPSNELHISLFFKIYITPPSREIHNSLLAEKSKYTFRQQGREIHIPLFEKYVKKYTSPIETEAVRCSAKSYFVPETPEKSDQGSCNSSPIPETSYEDIFLLDTTEEDTKN